MVNNIENIVKSPKNPPFQVRTSGVVKNQYYHSTGLKDNDYMITAFLTGKGTCWSRGKKYQVDAGMIGFLTDPQDLLMADEEVPYYHYYCRFSGDYARYMVDEIIQKNDLFFKFDNVETVAELLRSMGRFHHPFLPEQMGKEELLLIQALMLLTGKETESQVPRLSNHSITGYLNERIALPTDLDLMAEHFQVSKSTLCRAARKYFGLTIQKIHEQIKIDWAKVLLKSKNLTINDVARRVGYQDQLYFFRVFKKYTGLPPGKWRKNSNIQ